MMMEKHRATQEDRRRVFQARETIRDRLKSWRWGYLGDDREAALWALLDELSEYRRQIESAPRGTTLTRGGGFRTQRQCLAGADRDIHTAMKAVCWAVLPDVMASRI